MKPSSATDVERAADLVRAAPGAGEEIDCYRRRGIITPGGAKSLIGIFLIFTGLCRFGFPKAIVLKSRCFLEL